jgi:ATP synthase protein I
MKKRRVTNVSKSLISVFVRKDTRIVSPNINTRTPPRDASAMAQGFRLSAEFVSGIAAGTLLGWIIDQLAATTPWGFIIGLLFGFAAGMMNLMRTAGVFKKTRR